MMQPSSSELAFKEAEYITCLLHMIPSPSSSYLSPHDPDQQDIGPQLYTLISAGLAIRMKSALTSKSVPWSQKNLAISTCFAFIHTLSH